MAISDLIPWKKNRSEKSLQQRKQEDPISELQQEMNRLFEDFFERPGSLSPFAGERGLQASFSPKVDISETENEVQVSVELPGMDPEEIEISYTGNSLTISGEKGTEKEEKGKQFYRKERTYGSFRRSIPLPGAIEEDKIEASYQNGLLEVTLPKAAGASQQGTRIKVHSG